MKYRNPRIAWSVVWGIATVLLTVLWAQSYSSMQLWHFSRTHAAMVVDGTIMIDGAWVKTNRIAPYEPGAIINTWDHGPHYTYDRVGGLNIPCCLSVIVVFVVGILPWLRWRFSLRTLLIVTTLVAVGLGLVAWLQPQNWPLVF